MFASDARLWPPCNFRAPLSHLYSLKNFDIIYIENKDRKVCDVVMLSASEALEIARECSRSEYELKSIEPYVKAKAMEGKYKATIYPSIPLHLKTIEELRRLGYRVTACLDERNHYSYRIEWGDDE